MFNIIYVNNFVFIVPAGYNRSIIIKLLVILFLKSQCKYYKWRPYYFKTKPPTFAFK